MALGEGPGLRESQCGRPFVETAPAGAELSRYFNGIRLPHRGEIFITNLVREWVGGAPTKKQDVRPEDIERDEWELHVELADVQPRLIVCLGRHATRWVLNAPVDLEAVHGLLFRVAYCQSCGHRQSMLSETPTCACHHPQFLYALPVYHPAAGLHQPELAARTAYGFDILASLLKMPLETWAARCWAPAPKGTYIDYTSEAPYNHIAVADEGIDTEGTPSNPWGLSLAVMSGVAAVARFAEWNGEPLLVSQNLPTTRFVFHNYPWDRRVLAAKAMAVDEDRFDDTMLMAYLLGIEPLGLKSLALRHLGRVRQSYEETVGEWQIQIGKTGRPLKKKKLVLKSLDDIPRQQATDYAGADADDTLSLKPILWQRVVDLGLEQVYEIDRRVLPLYSRMEEVGLPIDVVRMAIEAEWTAHRLAEKTEALEQQYPGLNPASPDQVADLLFQTLKLPWHKKTPTGKRPSTNDKYLQALRHEHPIVEQIIDWRELRKHQGTFIDPMPEYCREVDGWLRLFFELSPYRVVSGRVAYKRPNVGALPKHSELGKRFRRLVRPHEGRKLGEWDLDAIELRVLALDSGSSTLRQLFSDGADIHGRTAARIFGGKPEDYGKASEANSAKRVAAKGVSFGIVMGTTCWGLADQQRKNGYPFPELAGLTFASYKKRIEAEAEVCQQWIDAVIKDWGIAGYISEMHAMARRYGYVQDRWGRKRWLPSALSPNQAVRSEALRQAQAFGPQAGARGFMKKIEARVWREIIRPFNAQGYYVEPLLDCHDALLLEFDEEIAEVIEGLVGEVFNHTFSEAIPISAKGKTGVCWGDL